MGEELTTGQTLVVYFEAGSKKRMEPFQLEKMVRNALSWLRYLIHVMGGPPARMRVDMGTRSETIFVVQASRMRHGETFDDLATKYPET